MLTQKRIIQHTLGWWNIGLIRLIRILSIDVYTQQRYVTSICYRFKVNNTAEILVVAIEVEVKSGAGLHWGGSSGVINLGMGGSLQPPIHHPIALKNSAKKAIKVVVSLYVHWTLKFVAFVGS